VQVALWMAELDSSNSLAKLQPQTLITLALSQQTTSLFKFKVPETLPPVLALSVFGVIEQRPMLQPMLLLFNLKS
jgi:hypothetical protein